MKTNIFGLVSSLLLFVIFLVLSVSFQSIYFVYIASVLPLFIVLFLPDIRSNQTIRSGKNPGAVKIIKVQANDVSSVEQFVLVFEPGSIDWNKSQLYFCPEEAVTYSALKPGPYTAAIPVLKYDLREHPRKKSYVGIFLPNLIERTKQLSYTTNEVNRLVIQAEDLDELLSHSLRKVASSGRSLGT